jgi:hypothetical protein
MELKLHIYEGRKIVKTYTAESIDLSLGVIEDVIAAFDFEHIDINDKTAMIKTVLKCKDQIKPFLMDIFDGLTAEEVRKTRTQNLIDVFRGLYSAVVEELGLIGSKN